LVVLRFDLLDGLLVLTIFGFGYSHRILLGNLLVLGQFLEEPFFLVLKVVDVAHEGLVLLQLVLDEIFEALVLHPELVDLFVCECLLVLHRCHLDFEVGDSMLVLAIT
jgi:hypothetical protein